MSIYKVKKTKFTVLKETQYSNEKKEINLSVKCIRSK